MEFQEVLDQRYSCRGFLDKPVDAGVVKKLVASAQWVPSWGNTQPWKAYAAGGETAKKIRAGLVEALSSGSGDVPEVEMPPQFEGHLMDRYRTLGRALFEKLGIGREDHEARMAHYTRNFDAFGAPALIYVTIPAGQTEYVVLDAGAFVAAICLAATDLGMATLVLAGLARFPSVVRGHIDIPDDEKILIGVALGYPDPQAKANEFRSTREALDNVLTLVDF